MTMRYVVSVCLSVLRRRAYVSYDRRCTDVDVQAYVDDRLYSCTVRRDVRNDNVRVSTGCLTDTVCRLRRTMFVRFTVVRCTVYTDVGVRYG